MTICEGYGLTEATCLVSINPPDGEKKVGSVGIPFPYTEVRIIDRGSGAGLPECGTDEVGEICVSNPGVLPRQDLHRSDQERRHVPPARPTAQFLRTGDLGRIDEDGYVWITGRAKDLIIRGGHNIDPAEIEEALAGHRRRRLRRRHRPARRPCRRGALRLCRTGRRRHRDGEALLAFASARINERAAQPQHLEILEELPKTAVGKIFKPDLRRWPSPASTTRRWSTARPPSVRRRWSRTAAAA